MVKTEWGEKSTIPYNEKAYGIKPKCKRCPLDCKQYNSPTLRVWCEKDKDFDSKEAQVFRTLRHQYKPPRYTGPEDEA